MTFCGYSSADEDVQACCLSDMIERAVSHEELKKWTREFMSSSQFRSKIRELHQAVRALLA
jgi:hypothetical protein